MHRELGCLRQTAEGLMILVTSYTCSWISLARFSWGCLWPRSWSSQPGSGCCQCKGLFPHLAALPEMGTAKVFFVCWKQWGWYPRVASKEEILLLELVGELGSSSIQARCVEGFLAETQHRAAWKQVRNNVKGDAVEMSCVTKGGWGWTRVQGDWSWTDRNPCFRCRWCRRWCRNECLHPWWATRNTLECGQSLGRRVDGCAGPLW